MISPKSFCEKLAAKQINFFTGVPDSLLKGFCSYVTDCYPPASHIIAANEGAAVALAAGHYLATGNIPLVYMQNSGQGNALNPLISLVDPEVYAVPMLLLIGWRGQAGIKDEPQHIKQGRITEELLKAAEIPYAVLTESNLKSGLEHAYEYMTTHSAPYALLVPKGTFAPYKLQQSVKTDYEMQREDLVRLIVTALQADDIVVSTTGKTSRELFECREALGQGHSQDFLTVGSMGHASQIALGIALQKTERAVYCLDGDGALIMHMGSLAVIGSSRASNFKHIIINNGAHDSVGGQPTTAFEMDIPNLARACGYKHALYAETRAAVEAGLKEIKESPGPCLLEVRVNKGARVDLGRPTSTPQENKQDFMRHLRQ